MKNKNKLDDKQQKIATRLGIRKFMKLAHLSKKIFNKSCADCKAKILVNPKDMSRKKFCKDCLEKVDPIIEKVDRLTQ